MDRTVIAAAVASVGLLAGCEGASEPAQPPTSQDALTTTTAPAPPSESVATSEPVVATQEPTAAGPPGQENTMDEIGAEAAVEHYIATLSAVHQEAADVDELRALAEDSCRTCQGFANAAAQTRFGREYVRHISSDAAVLGDEARVETRMEQVDEAKEIETVFSLTWRDSRWLVSEIQLSGN